MGSVVEHAVTIRAEPDAIWRTIVEESPRWMGGFRLVSSWEVGGPLAVTGTLNGREYEERGTLLACEPGGLLRYEHWSRLWRVPDVPENRATLEIRLRREGSETHVAFRHELPGGVEALREHSEYFWGVALALLKQAIEEA